MRLLRFVFSSVKCTRPLFTTSPVWHHNNRQYAFYTEPDIFALSRIKNYCKRVSEGGGAPTFSHSTDPNGLCVAALSLPVDVFVSNQIARKHITATGYGETQKIAEAACCMHAEAALDSAGIPLFLSSERQARRVEEAKGTGRYVPSLGDYPKSFEDIVVPPPVRIGAEETEDKSTAVAPDKVAVPEAEVTITYVTVEEPSTTDGTMEKVEYVIPEDVIESLPVARQPSVKRCFPFDVTEGGLYDEVDFAEWLNHTYLPSPPSVCDLHAPGRLNEIYQKHFQADFKDCVTTAIKELQLSASGVQNTEKCKVYISSVSIPYYEGIVAVGKGFSVEHALVLCAMHVERLFRYLGIQVFQDPDRQAHYNNGCRDLGIAFHEERVALTAAVLGKLPKPLAEAVDFHAPGRYSSLNSESLHGRLLKYSRVLSGAQRKNVVEVDVHANPLFTEVFSLSYECIRSFMRHHGHPEAAFYIRDIGGQVRASLYLPLPTHFGIRGGFGIAPTSGVAKDLCALSAVDVLCFVNAIPPECLERPEWQAMLQKRKALRLLLPGDAHNVAKLTDSPPGYVGIAGGSQYIPSLQRINEIRSADVSFYDVVPPIVDGAFADRTVILRALDGLADMLVTYVRYATGNEMYMQMHLFHYKGIQQFRRSRRLMANNFWMPLPLMGDTLGKHMAHGRGESRADARRHFLLHAFRILRYLDALPWDHLDDNGSFADSNAAQLQTEVQYLTVLEKEGFLPPARKNANAAKRVTEIPRPLISFVLKEKSTR